MELNHILIHAPIDAMAIDANGVVRQLSHPLRLLLGRTKSVQHPFPLEEILQGPGSETLKAFWADACLDTSDRAQCIGSMQLRTRSGQSTMTCRA